ncbi:hypothetical protein PP740_gp051 [Stenotrophomonas phage Philippe]|uniref:Uncharacterized protein n=1 Tax=Stenotrophomonas phage Philippe TaxID=2859655 RepID=A0AAE8BJN4_9CAUD|nr:hypothetical protein PP740_gp051 [Stenotrophomonas phage Philippe]QYW02291.1 hypothetical protein CPT_Philippe_098 [Stenotrophomonas phage Philippe]
MKNKVELSDVEEAIKGETYTVLPDRRTTICQLTLDNGFTVDGHSACVDEANFDQELGQKYSRAEAVKKVWAYLGFRLADRMAVLQAAAAPQLVEEGSQTYVGVKAVHAVPMTRGEYNTYRGWTIPPDEDPEEAGYRIEYLTDGYVSWHPAKTFHDSYKPVDAKPSTYGSRLRAETVELATRLKKLGVFLNSEDFKKLDEVDQKLLAHQALSMNNYLKVLNVRVARAG